MVLNAGLYMGYAKDIYRMLKSKKVATDDEQFYSKIFRKLGKELDIKLDYRSELFQILNDSPTKEVDLYFFGNETFSFKMFLQLTYYILFFLILGDEPYYVANKLHKTLPLVFYANDPIGLLTLNTIGNYIPKNWNQKEGCLGCKEDIIDLSKKKVGPNKYDSLSISIISMTDMNHFPR